MKGTALVLMLIGILHAGETLAQVSETVVHSPATDLEAAEQGNVESIAVEVSSPAAAAPEPATTGNAGVKNRMIEEIVVTAQKREERLQDVPISIQAFGGDALAARGIETTQDLGQSVPSLNFTIVSGFTMINMRGIGTDNFIPSADPSIATYVDGIYLAAGQGVAQSLGSVQRVEVLKGPQGTLFGRNSTGGAISIVTDEPGDAFEGSIEGELGGFDARSAKFSLSGPITDWLSASASGLTSRKDSFFASENFDMIPEKRDAYRFRTNIHPSENLSLSLTAFHAEQEGAMSQLGDNIQPSLLGRLAGIQPAKDDYRAETDYPAVAKGKQKVYYGTLSWQLPWLDVKLLGSDQRIRSDPVRLDFDGSPLPLVGFSVTNQFSDVQSGELQLLSNAETPFSDKFQWVAGLYYYQGKVGVDPAQLSAAPGALTSLVNLGVPLPQGLLDLLGELPIDNTPLGSGGAGLTFRGILGTKSESAYAQGTYYFTDWLDLTLGGRFQRERRYTTKASTGLTDLSGGEGSTTLLPFPLQSTTAENFSPKAVLSMRPRKNALIYGSYAVGFKSGTYNIVNIYAPPDYIVPEKVTTYEIGAKLDFLDGLLRVNGAVFQNDIDNLQSGFVSLLSGGAVTFLTVPSARTRGVELDGTLVPFPDWNPGLALSGNAAYIDAKYTDFPNAQGFREGTGIYSENLNATGNEIVRAPKLSGGVGLVQSIELSQGTIEIAVDEYYSSGFYYDAYNTVKENPYAILNARVGYLYAPWNLRVTAFGKNLLDRRYHFQRLQTDFGLTSALAEPREYGLRLGWEF